MWSVTFFFFLCHLLNVGACICHIVQEGLVEWTTPKRWEENEFKFHSVICYTNSIVSCIHVNTTKLCNITCTLVATFVIRQSLVCTRRSDWGLAWTLKISSNRIIWFHQVRRKGFIVRVGSKNLLILCGVLVGKNLEPNLWSSLKTMRRFSRLDGSDWAHMFNNEHIYSRSMER